MKENKSTETKVQALNAARMALWSGTKIVNSDKTGQATDVRKNPVCSFVSRTVKKKKNILLFEEKKHEEKPPTYTDAEWRQWRSKPHVLVLASSPIVHCVCDLFRLSFSRAQFIIPDVMQHQMRDVDAVVLDDCTVP